MIPQKLTSKEMALKTIESLKGSMLNCNIFSVYDYDCLTMQELLCKFFEKINQCIDATNKTVVLVEWLVDQGISQEIAKKLTAWLQDGTLANIINEVIFAELNAKITQIDNKVDQGLQNISTQVNNKVDQFKGEVNNRLEEFKFKKYVGKKIAVLGDVQTEQNFHKTKTYGEWLKDLTGASSVTHYAKENACFTRNDKSGASSIYHIIDNMANDFDLIVVSGGLPDMIFNSTLGDFSDNGERSVFGSLDRICRKLLNKYKGKQIVFMTPTECGSVEYNKRNTSGITMNHIADAMKMVCNHNSIPVYDAFGQSGISPSINGDIYTTGNKVYLNNKGHEVIGKQLYDFIKGGCVAGSTVNYSLFSEAPKWVGKWYYNNGLRNPQFMHMVAMIENKRSYVGKAVTFELEINNQVNFNGDGTTIQGDGNTIWSYNKGILGTGSYGDPCSNTVTFTNKLTPGGAMTVEASGPRTITEAAGYARYLIIPILLKPTASDCSFKIAKFDVKVDGNSVPVLKLGGMYPEEYYEIG